MLAVKVLLAPYGVPRGGIHFAGRDHTVPGCKTAMQASKVASQAVSSSERRSPADALGICFVLACKTPIYQARPADLGGDREGRGVE